MAMTLEELLAFALHVCAAHKPPPKHSPFMYNYNSLTATIFLVSRRDAVLVGLLNACVKKLQNEGMSKIFLDGVSGGVDGFKLLGEHNSIGAK